MEQEQYLMDTNIVIDYLGNKLPTSGMEFINDVVDTAPTVSVITKIEVLGFNTSNEHTQLLENFMDDVSVLDLTAYIVDKTIELRKKYKTKLPDAIIAASALVYDLILLTRNIADFKNIESLEVRNPYDL